MPIVGHIDETSPVQFPRIAHRRFPAPMIAQTSEGDQSGLLCPWRVYFRSNHPCTSGAEKTSFWRIALLDQACHRRNVRDACCFTENVRFAFEIAVARCRRRVCSGVGDTWYRVVRLDNFAEYAQRCGEHVFAHRHCLSKHCPPSKTLIWSQSNIYRRKFNVAIFAC